MVNRVRKEREDKMNVFYDKQTAKVHRQAVEAEKAFKKSVHHEENSDIEALLFHREDEFSGDQMNANYRKYPSMVLSGQMKDINVNDINYMKGRYTDAPDDSGNKLSLHDFYVNNADGAIDYMREFNPRIYDDKEYKKFYDTFNVKNKSIAEGMKYKPGALTATWFNLNEADMQQIQANSYRPWDNSFMNK
jgi:hypothetical protein